MNEENLLQKTYNIEDFESFLSSVGNLSYKLYNADEVSKVKREYADAIREVGEKLSQWWVNILDKVGIDLKRITPPNFVFLKEEDFAGTLGASSDQIEAFYSAYTNTIFVNMDCLISPESKSKTLLRIFENLLISATNVEVIQKVTEGNETVTVINNRVYRILTEVCDLEETDVLRQFGGYIFFGVGTNDKPQDKNRNMSGDMLQSTDIFSTATSETLLLSLILASLNIDNSDAKVVVVNKRIDFGKLYDMLQQMLSRVKKVNPKRKYVPFVVIPDETIDLARSSQEMDLKALATENPEIFERIIKVTFKALHDLDFKEFNELRDELKANGNKVYFDLLILVRTFLDSPNNFRRAFEDLIMKAVNNIKRFKVEISADNLSGSIINIMQFLARKDVITVLGEKRFTSSDLYLDINIPNYFGGEVIGQGPHNPIVDIFESSLNPTMEDYQRLEGKEF